MKPFQTTCGGVDFKKESVAAKEATHSSISLAAACAEMPLLQNRSAPIDPSTSRSTHGYIAIRQSMQAQAGTFFVRKSQAGNATLQLELTGRGPISTFDDAEIEIDGMRLLGKPATSVDLVLVPSRFQFSQGSNDPEDGIDGVGTLAHFADMTRCSRASDLKP
jgi:hypothetical protein